jgi:hypothetical protein
LEIGVDADIARAVQAAATKVRGHPAPIAGDAFWTDAAFLSAAAIPSLLLVPPVREPMQLKNGWISPAWSPARKSILKPRYSFANELA